MSQALVLGAGGASGLGRLARRRLADEVALWEAAGSETVVFEPAADDTEPMSLYPRRDRSLGDRVMDAGREAVRRVLEPERQSEANPSDACSLRIPASHRS